MITSCFLLNQQTRKLSLGAGCKAVWAVSTDWTNTNLAENFRQASTSSVWECAIPCYFGHVFPGLTIFPCRQLYFSMVLALLLSTGNGGRDVWKNCSSFGLHGFGPSSSWSSWAVSEGSGNSLLRDVPRCTAGYHKKSSSANPWEISPHSTVYRRDWPAYSYIRW